MLHILRVHANPTYGVYRLSDKVMHIEEKAIESAEWLQAAREYEVKVLWRMVISLSLTASRNQYVR